MNIEARVISSINNVTYCESIVLINLCLKMEGFFLMVIIGDDAAV